MGQIIEQNVYNYLQRRLLMKAVILNASGWIIFPINVFFAIKYFNNTNVAEFIIKKSLILKSKNRFIWEK